MQLWKLGAEFYGRELFSMHETQGLSSRSKPKKYINSKDSGINGNSFKNYSLGEGSVQAEVRGIDGNRFFPFYHVVLRDQAHVIRLSSKYLYSLLHLAGQSFFLLATCTYLFFPIPEDFNWVRFLPLMEYLAIYTIIFYCQNYKDATVTPWVELRKDSKELTSHKAAPQYRIIYPAMSTALPQHNASSNKETCNITVPSLAGNVPVTCTEIPHPLEFQENVVGDHGEPEHQVVDCFAPCQSKCWSSLS